MNDTRQGSFWPSYVDVMTTLFAIMLVLFVVSYSRFKHKEKEHQALLKEYNDIKRVYTTINSIDATNYFEYDDQYLKHLFTVNVEYQEKEYRIDRLKLDKVDAALAQQKRDSIVEAGRLIQQTILRMGGEGKDLSNIKFLVVIEGQSSRIAFDVDDWRNNYTLSYLRAQFLNEFWREHGIDLAATPRCELIVSGSGEGGVPRVTPTAPEGDALWREQEIRNQRFLIHIVPVIGNIAMPQEKTTP